MILVECILEWRVAGGAGGLLARTGAHSGTTHQIILITILLVALLVDSPEDQTHGTDDNGTADTNDDTDDDLLVGRRNTAGAGALIPVERWFSSRGGSGGHHSGRGRSIAAGRVRGDGLHDGSLGG